MHKLLSYWYHPQEGHDGPPVVCQCTRWVSTWRVNVSFMLLRPSSAVLFALHIHVITCHKCNALFASLPCHHPHCCCLHMLSIHVVIHTLVHLCCCPHICSPMSLSVLLYCCLHCCRCHHLPASSSTFTIITL